MKNIQIFMTILLLCVSCGTTKYTSEVVYPARKQCFSLVNGEASMELPSVVLLMSTSGSQVGQCTGTFVSGNTLLTAAHCVQKTPTGDVTAYLDDCANNRTIPVKSTAVFHSGIAGEDFPADSASGDLSAVAPKDVAVVLFPAGTAPSTMPISASPVKKSDDLLMVGFGSAISVDSTQKPDAFGQFIKRRGHGIFEADEASDMIRVDHPDPKSAALSHGDSGGPLVLGTKIIGIASLGSASMSEWVNLFSAQSRAVLEQAKAGGGEIEGWDEYAAAQKASPAPSNLD